MTISISLLLFAALNFIAHHNTFGGPTTATTNGGGVSDLIVMIGMCLFRSLISAVLCIALRLEAPDCTANAYN
jgi:hypothetical protein